MEVAELVDRMKVDLSWLHCYGKTQKRKFTPLKLFLWLWHCGNSETITGLFWLLAFLLLTLLFWCTQNSNYNREKFHRGIRLNYATSRMKTHSAAGLSVIDIIYRFYPILFIGMQAMIAPLPWNYPVLSRVRSLNLHLAISNHHAHRHVTRHIKFPFLEFHSSHDMY